MEDGPDLLNWDGDDHIHDADRLNISSQSAPTETSFVSIGEENSYPDRDAASDMEMSPIDAHGYYVRDNPNEAAVAPNASDVPATRMSNLRCGGTIAAYHSPKSLLLTSHRCSVNLEPAAKPSDVEPSTKRRKKGPPILGSGNRISIRRSGRIVKNVLQVSVDGMGDVLLCAKNFC